MVPARSLISGFEVGNSDAKFQVLEIFDSPEIVLVTIVNAPSPLRHSRAIPGPVMHTTISDVTMTPGELAESDMNLKTCLAPHWSTFSEEIQELEEAGIIM
jgi:hypothetical protein